MKFYFFSIQNCLSNDNVKIVHYKVYTVKQYKKITFLYEINFQPENGVYFHHSVKSYDSWINILKKFNKLIEYSLLMEYDQIIRNKKLDILLNLS